MLPGPRAGGPFGRGEGACCVVIAGDAVLMGRAEQIRAAVNVRYRRSAGRKLAVTEAATTSVVASISLLDHRFAAARVVDADTGIYFAVCPANATCPYPRPSSSWPATAGRPLRVAVELAVRAFRETRTDLVVVALPTHQPVWLVLERDDIVGSMHWPALRTIASRDPAVADAALLRRIDRCHGGICSLPSVWCPSLQPRTASSRPR